MKMVCALFNTYLQAGAKCAASLVAILLVVGDLGVPSVRAEGDAPAPAEGGSGDKPAVDPKSSAKPKGSGKDKAGEKPAKKSKKEKSTIMLQVESNPDPTGRTMEVTVLRSTPMVVTIMKEPILTEAHLISAKLEEVPGGGFEIWLQFDNTGRMLLENYSASQRGKRLVVFSDFGQRRYVGVKKMTRLISDGIFSFSPDASREEAERIVRGLERVAKDNVKRDKW